MYMPVSAACQSCSFLGGQQQLLHIPVLFFLSNIIYAFLIAFHTIFFTIIGQHISTIFVLFCHQYQLSLTHILIRVNYIDHVL
jgi:hypothetical protein